MTLPDDHQQGYEGAGVGTMKPGQLVVGGLFLTWWGLFLSLVLLTVLSGARGG